jgi:hypothetical protein
MMNRRNIYVEIAYLLFIGATLGAVLVLGVIVAAVIFNSESYLSVALLDHYNEGVLMAEVFRRFAYWAYALSAVVALYEVLEYRALRRDGIAQISALSVIATSLMFAAVYTPKILLMQLEGADATATEAFDALHKASEMDFKILAVALGVLFVRRVMMLRTVKR